MQAGGGTKNDTSKSSYKKTNDIYTDLLTGKSRTYKTKEVVQKGDKTIVNTKQFTKDGDGNKYPTEKSTTVYNKKTGTTKVVKSGATQYNPALIGKGSYSTGVTKYATHNKTTKTAKK